MKEEEFKPIAKELLKQFGLVVNDITSREGVLTPDFETICKNSKYTLELKIKGDDAEEVTRDSEALSRGENVENIQSVKQTQTEEQLEEVITRCPELLVEDLKLIGRQTETHGGPLDLLGVDSDGRLVVFKLKRGILTREAIAQIIDYSSYLATLPQDELSEHISSRSGNLGNSSNA